MYSRRNSREQEKGGISSIFVSALMCANTSCYAGCVTKNTIHIYVQQCRICTYLNNLVLTREGERRRELSDSLEHNYMHLLYQLSRKSRAHLIKDSFKMINILICLWILSDLNIASIAFVLQLYICH